MSDAPIRCVCPSGRSSCATLDAWHRDQCKRAGLCLASDAGVTFQEVHMRQFFTWLFSGEPGGQPADHIVRDPPRSVVQENYERSFRVKGSLGR